MQRISDWTNLSECTFMLPPTTDAADYRVRIFSLRTELPFAGHPTLGTARAWLDAGGTPRDPGTVVQECAAGLIPVRRDGDALAFAAPPTVRGGEVDAGDLERVTAVLGITPAEVVAARWVDNGPGWVGLLLEDAEAVLALRPDASQHPGAWFIGVAGPSTEPGAQWEVRGFFADDAPLREDPVTGSLNASLAQWLLASGRATAPYTARQGTALGRDGRVRIDSEGDVVWVGGATHVAVRGEIDA
jgi:PhzF family phenazine biosynthesis protein